ncbi:Kelch repeat-containing protein [Lachnellula suecica]|uniref:Kelch repeat-containing protein n=1 Tax=Lachnellula suecica TaxID=602035 RepID=A0A8T9C939_9HELO|nr:Kelch repeat-containing protein [Lachnellula suecica]
MATAMVRETASASANSSYLDPISNMCERFFHQSTVKNDVLYVWGGAETFVANNSDGRADGAITIGTNNFMIAMNMNSSWDWKINISESVLTPAPSPPPGNTSPPVIIRGALFSGGLGDDNVYIYGGTTSALNSSFVDYTLPISPEYSLWSYNTATNQWGQYDISHNTSQRPSSGAYAEVPDQNLAFYLNGEITNGTSTLTLGIGSELMTLEGLVIIDTAAHTSRNVSTGSLVGSNPRTGGVLQYVTGIGSKGVLVSIGGSYRQSYTSSTDEIGSLLSMDTIDILDINSTYNEGQPAWYSQKATGDIPPARVQFCSVAVAAFDNSSYHIYIYGGKSSPTSLFDDIYTLSLPSFIWTNVYNATIPIPRYGHTCHLVGRRQMLTVGGSGSTEFKSCDWETKGVAVYDLTTLTWGSEYDFDALDYGVPAPITSIIGGNYNGSANITQPIGGFTTPELAALFKENRLEETPPKTPSSTPPPNSTTDQPNLGETKATNRVGIIAGAATGSVITLIFIGWAIWRFCRRTRAPQSNPLRNHSVRSYRQRFARSPSLKNVDYDFTNPCG